MIQAALAGPCADTCQAQYDSCAALSAAGCELAGKGAEKLAGRALGGVPGGGLMAGFAGSQAKSICEEKLAPCNTALAQCLEVCPAEAATSSGVAQVVAAPAPLLVFGQAAGASIWIDGMRAGTLPSSSADPYTSPPLLPGTHTVRVVDAAGSSWETEVTVATGVINSVEVGALRSEDERGFAAAVLLEQQGQAEAALAVFTAMAVSTTDPALAAEARSAAARITAARDAAIEAAARQNANAAKEDWKHVLNQSDDRWAQRSAAVDWLTRYGDDENQRIATDLIAETDALIATHLTPALDRFEAFELAGAHAERVRASQAARKALKPARAHGLEPYLESRAVESGVWVPADARGDKRALWRAEQQRSSTGRGWLIAGSVVTAIALPASYQAGADLQGARALLVGANVALGAGLLATVETRHARLHGVYRGAMPSTGRLPSAAAPLLTVGALELAVFQGLKANEASSSWDSTCFGDCPSVAEQIEERRDEDWAAAQALNMVAISGWLNVGLGLAAVGLHHGAGRAAGRVHLSPTGLTGSF